MPTDVVIGQGRMGDALLGAFPGQYRDPETEVKTFDGQNWFSTVPGNSRGVPTSTDPDRPRRFATIDMPGVGQVVVPVDHTVAQVVNVEQQLAGQVFPGANIEMNGLGQAADAAHSGWHAALVKAIDDTAHETNAAVQLSKAFTKIADLAVKEAMRLIQSGRVTTVQKAVQLVTFAINSAAQRFNQLVQSTAHAVSIEVAKSKQADFETAIRKALAKRPARGPAPHRMMMEALPDGQNIFPVQGQMVQSLELERANFPGMTDRGNMADWRGSMYGFGDAASDAALLAAVVADAQKTQAFHQLVIQKMADREKETPGVLGSDDNLRNAFLDTLAQTEQDFTSRNLQLLGVQYPYQLDRTAPAHAIVIAVRDDIKDTESMLTQRRWQVAIAKQVQEVKGTGINFPKLPTIPWTTIGIVALIGIVAAKKLGFL